MTLHDANTLIPVGFVIGCAVGAIAMLIVGSRR